MILFFGQDVNVSILLFLLTSCTFSYKTKYDSSHLGQHFNILIGIGDNIILICLNKKQLSTSPTSIGIFYTLKIVRTYFITKKRKFACVFNTKLSIDLKSLNYF